MRGARNHRVAPEHPFNVQTAMLRAGAQAACGPLWGIDDDVASLFSRRLFDYLNDGSSLAAAYRAVAAEVAAAHPDLRAT